ncbi:hypothetical protein CSOJ01_14576 [Colletotrichum sojae]|uniref:Uncharacterized protein n=1 Tax=Colletotrichum sojae TaxID=2175907 RepID=A0A8H6MIW4_9PEZI|nr:hypothetical protein CSOJ01_14576 [Colletotrichum sojae]
MRWRGLPEISHFTVASYYVGVEAAVDHSLSRPLMPGWSGTQASKGHGGRMADERIASECGRAHPRDLWGKFAGGDLDRAGPACRIVISTPTAPVCMETYTCSTANERPTPEDMLDAWVRSDNLIRFAIRRWPSTSVGRLRWASAPQPLT